MIYFKVSGGLGNQLFQLAVIKALSLKSDVRIDISDYKKYAIHEGFLLEELFPLNSEICNLPNIMNVINKISARGVHIPYVYHDYHNRYVTCSNKSGYWFGTFQSPNYFEQIQDEVITEYRHLIYTKVMNASHLLERIDCDSALIHLRLGDYNTGRYAKLLGGLYRTEYLRDAILEAKSNGFKKFKIICNGDARSFIEEYQLEEFDYEIIDNGSLSAFECLYLMINAKYFIGWNSSLSWWGAFLRSSEHKGVLPSKWFFESDWEQIFDESNKINYIKL